MIIVRHSSRITRAAACYTVHTREVLRSTEKQVSSESEKRGVVAWRELPSGVNKNDLLIGPARCGDFFDQKPVVFVKKK